jgi:dienelactone hydrolase
LGKISINTENMSHEDPTEISKTIKYLIKRDGERLRDIDDIYSELEKNNTKINIMGACFGFYICIMSVYVLLKNK